MKKLLHRYLSVFLATLAISSLAIAEEQIFVDVDEDGVPNFSDTRSAAGEEIKLRESTTYSPPDSKSDAGRNLPAWKRGDDDEIRNPQEPPPPVYKASITSPEHDSTLRDNAGNLTVEVKLTPALQSGYRGDLLLDGHPVSTVNASGPVNLTNLDRGTHTLQVRIFNPADKVVHESSAVVVNILRASRLH